MGWLVGIETIKFWAVPPNVWRFFLNGGACGIGEGLVKTRAVVLPEVGRLNLTAARTDLIGAEFRINRRSRDTEDSVAGIHRYDSGKELRHVLGGERPEYAQDGG